MGARAWALLLVLCGTIFLEGADIAMMAVAIPSIRSDLGLATDTAAWVMSAYVLGYAGFTLLGGRAADLLGRRRMFLLWLTVFLAFSGLGGFATEGWMLVVARFVTGVSAAFMTPAALSLITTSLRGGPAAQQGPAGLRRHRSRRFLPRPGDRRPAHRARLALGVLRAGADGRRPAPRGLPADPAPAAPPPTGHGFDLPGALTAAGAMLLAAYTVVRLEHGLDAWRSTTASALGALLLGGRLRRRGAPGRAPAGPARDPAHGTGRAGRPRGAAVRRRLLRLPVRGDALSPGTARLVLGADRDRPGDHGLRRGPRAHAHPAARRPLRQRTRDRRRLPAGGARLRPLPAGRHGLALPGDVPDADHRGHRLRAGVRAADDRGDGRGRRVRAGPGGRAAAHGDPVRLGDRDLRGDGGLRPGAGRGRRLRHPRPGSPPSVRR